MKIQMKRSHGSYKPGDVVELPDRQAQSLIAWDYAVEVRDKQSRLIETGSIEPTAERADMTPRRRRQ